MSYAEPRFESPSARQVEEASLEGVVVLLLEGAHRFTGELLKAVDAADESGKEASIDRIIPILEALLQGLDLDSGEVAANLARLYEWWGFEVQAAAGENDAPRLRKVQAQILEIRDSWTRQAQARTA